MEINPLTFEERKSTAKFTQRLMKSGENRMSRRNRPSRIPSETPPSSTIEPTPIVTGKLKSLLNEVLSGELLTTDEDTVMLELEALRAENDNLHQELKMAHQANITGVPNVAEWSRLVDRLRKEIAQLKSS